MVLVIDNYDSFTYNLVQYLGELGAEIVVRRNNQAALEELLALRPDRIVISPGPGRPEEAGISLDVIRAFGSACRSSACASDTRPSGWRSVGRSCGRPSPFTGRPPRSSTMDWACSPGSAPASRPAAITRSSSPRRACRTTSSSARARAVTSSIMGLRHREWPLHGVQFHPESVLTPEGRQLLRNFLAL